MITIFSYTLSKNTYFSLNININEILRFVLSSIYISKAAYTLWIYFNPTFKENVFCNSTNTLSTFYLTIFFFWWKFIVKTANIKWDQLSIKKGGKSEYI